MDCNFAGVDIREEVFAQPRRQEKGDRHGAQEGNYKDPAIRQRQTQGNPVDRPDTFEAFFKALLESDKRIARSGSMFMSTIGLPGGLANMLVRAKQVLRHHGDKGP